MRLVCEPEISPADNKTLTWKLVDRPVVTGGDDGSSFPRNHPESGGLLGQRRVFSQDPRVGARVNPGSWVGAGLFGF